MPTSALAIINAIRLEKNPPLARYCTLLVLAESSVPLTAHRIAKRMKCDSPQSGTIDSACRAGLIAAHPGQRSTSYSLTHAGRLEIGRILATHTNSLVSI